MENEFTPSRNYYGMFRDAKKIKNIDAMELIFNSLCDEIGYTDPERNQKNSDAGKETAERMNNRGKGPEAKVI